MIYVHGGVSTIYIGLTQGKTSMFRATGHGKVQKKTCFVIFLRGASGATIVATEPKSASKTLAAGTEKTQMKPYSSEPPDFWSFDYVAKKDFLIPLGQVHHFMVPSKAQNQSPRLDNWIARPVRKLGLEPSYFCGESSTVIFPSFFSQKKVPQQMDVSENVVYP